LILISGVFARADIPKLEKTIDDNEQRSLTTYMRGGSVILKCIEEKNGSAAVYSIYWKDQEVYRLMKNFFKEGAIERQYRTTNLTIMIYEWDLNGSGTPDYILLHSGSEKHNVAEMFWVSDKYEIRPVKSEFLFSKDGEILDEGSILGTMKRDPNSLKK
jgi:hypothetical protein